MTEDRTRAPIVVGQVSNARQHGDGVIARLEIAGIPEAGVTQVSGVFTCADVAALIDALPLERFDKTDQLSIEEAIEALRRDR